MADDTTEPVRPANSASKPEWVAYAKAYGIEESGTRDEIIARVDAAEAAGGPEHQPETVTFAPAAAAVTTAEATEEAGAAPEHEPETVSFAPPPAGTITGFKLLPSEDEPVRAGGHVLTDQGWIAEATLAQAETDEDGDPT
jgi:hypothetical protein